MKSDIFTISLWFNITFDLFGLDFLCIYRRHLVFPIKHTRCVMIKIFASVCPAYILLWEKSMYLHLKTKIYTDSAVHSLVFLLLNWSSFSLNYVDTSLLIKHIDVFRQNNLMSKSLDSGIYTWVWIMVLPITNWKLLAGYLNFLCFSCLIYKMGLTKEFIL